MSTDVKIRKECDIFKELEELCQSPGYVHAIAYFCYRDNSIWYVNKLRSEDVLQKFSMERLVRTEISTLIGLACKSKINETLPTPEDLQKYISRTESLLGELHQSMMPSPHLIFDSTKNDNNIVTPNYSGSALRESIFYGGESAYNFQYRDLFYDKYSKDNDWLIVNKGFSIDQAFSVIKAIQIFQNEKINIVNQELAGKHPDGLSCYDVFTFTLEEIATKSGLKIDVTKNVIESFISPIGQDEFKSIDDFNPVNAYPIIKLQFNKYLLFQYYSLTEAAYETPFYWFIADDGYKNIAMQHRGDFTEEFSSKRLELVFGKSRVFQNVDIVNKKSIKFGEIDTLVVFANRAIVLQAKSKKLTISARKGNDLSLNLDFKKAVQDAYDQAFSCSTLLMDNNYKLLDGKGNEIRLSRDFKEIYPFCVVSDHYPALSFQAMQFLDQKTSEIIKPAFVMDVFFLDVLTEILQSPLHFLSYINRRSIYGDKVWSTHELTILSYHLKKNLWMDGAYSMMYLQDDICADLDLAMMSRRNDVPGDEFPNGILTKFIGTHFDQLIKDIELLDHPSTVDFGFVLLTLSSDTIEIINEGISKLIESGKKDGMHHDFVLGFSDGSSGLTIHCNDDSYSVAAERLDHLCELRKYGQRAKQWFGICISTKTQRLRFGINKDFDWKQSDYFDDLTKGMPKLKLFEGVYGFKALAKITKSKKIGRNDVCPCGSGKKYKRCCI